MIRITVSSSLRDRRLGVSGDCQQQAQNHCPGQAIVWVDPRSQTYDASTDRFYGRTKTGAFVCLGEAENAGYRAKRRP